ncbi:hypothetical protein NKH56_27895 [Mesorhizobium sp. M1076]|uniref:hypothetical protein n=1 Tax=Mesorhizobium sp. M1076 TaxID=2957054 RepID=UPI0033394FEC
MDRTVVRRHLRKLSNRRLEPKLPPEVASSLDKLDSTRPDAQPDATVTALNTLPPMTQRYDIEKTPEGTWDVIDVFTGLPVVEVGVPLIDMPIEEADDLVGLLNYRDRRQRGDS